MQIPSNTWMRCRLPSITLKCTRSVSPALNWGRSVRMLRCSRLSMTLFIGEGGPEADAAWYQRNVERRGRTRLGFGGRWDRLWRSRAESAFAVYVVAYRCAHLVGQRRL